MSVHLNVELIRKIQGWLATPAAATHFDMADWLLLSGSHGAGTYLNLVDHGTAILARVEADVLDPDAHCGTTCCLAGAAAAFSDHELAVQAIKDGGGMEGAGMQLLGLDDRTAEHLFHYGAWPNDWWFAREYDRLVADDVLPFHEADHHTERSDAWVLLEALAAGRDPWVEQAEDDAIDDEPEDVDVFEDDDDEGYL